MAPPPLHLTRVGPVVVPVVDQEAALAFYVGVLGMAVVNDVAYETGERWLEVVPGDGSASLCLVRARPDRPAGVETGVIVLSTDVAVDHAALREAGVRTDAELLEPGVVVWWSGAPLAGRPDQFRVWDPDGNSVLIVAAPEGT
jgi:catechol 2,3-dioxygenase-like lactoylglutathione lyase family enzyme